MSVCSHNPSSNAAQATRGFGRKEKTIYTYASMPGYRPTDSNWRVAYALDQGVKEIRSLYPNVTCVGTIGDVRHQSEGGNSAHNPIVRAPDGSLLVLAVDLVGPLGDLTKIQNFLEAKYNAQDPRQYPRGFTQMNGEGTTWDSDPHTSLHFTGADYGHLHWNINTVNFPIQAGDYRPAMDSTSPWNIGTSPSPVNSQGDLDNMAPEDSKALAEDIATAFVNRKLGGVGFDGNVAQYMMAQRQLELDRNALLKTQNDLLTQQIGLLGQLLHKP